MNHAPYKLWEDKYEDQDDKGANIIRVYHKLDIGPLATYKNDLSINNGFEDEDALYLKEENDKGGTIVK